MNRGYAFRLSCVQITALLLCSFVYASYSRAAGLQVGDMEANRILFLGNSLTYHPPTPEIGWTGNWGMVAAGR